MNYFEEEYLQIKNEETIAIMEWMGLANSEEYHAGYEAFSNFLQEGKYTLWLLDCTYGRVINMTDQKWTSDEWFPNALELLEGGLRKVAVILSTDIFNKIATKLIMNAIMQNSEAEVAYFEEREEAMEWLLSYEPQTEDEQEFAEPA